ncbi:MAG: aspartyl/asparaginyl beta-hydroxylase domain-containing protein [Microthrixaceae bacterium]
MTTGLFAGYQPFTRSLSWVAPGVDKESLPHQNWMFTDERNGQRTFTVWIALDDITGDNGQLRVLRGSHRIDGQFRGTGLRSTWLDHVDVIKDRLLSIPLKAGQCAIFDNALSYCTYTNYSSRTSVAATIGMHRDGSQLVHFRNGDGSNVARCEVDTNFFATVTPRLIADSTPQQSCTDVGDQPERCYTASELAALLDHSLLAKRDWVSRYIHSTRATVVEFPTKTANYIRERREQDGGLPSRATLRKQTVKAVFTPGETGTKRAYEFDEVEERATREKLRLFIDDLPTKMAIAILGLNEAAINKFAPPTPPVWDRDLIEWSPRVEAHWPEILEEVNGLLDDPREVPRIEEVTGGIPQGNIGPWRSFVLMHQGKWIDWNCARCPNTAALMRTLPGLTMAGFSILEPGARITEHRGPNKGALRYQLGVIVPGEPGDCRIRVANEMVYWRDGEGVVFDFTFPHEAWNDSSEIRVLLMLEFITPGIPWYLAPTNRLAQRSMSWFPTTRNMVRNLRALESTLGLSLDAAFTD